MFLQYLAAYLEGCGTRIDFEFGWQLGKERDRLSKEQYKKLIDYLRVVQLDIREHYLQEISVAFDELTQQTPSHLPKQNLLDSAKLQDDDFVKEDYVINQIIRKCEHNFLEELSQFNQRLAMLLGKQVISSAQNPASPERLLRILFEVFKPLKLNSQYKIALYNVFDANVFSQLGFIYHELLPYCLINEATLENSYVAVTPVSNRVNTVVANRGFEPLRKKLQDWRVTHTPSAFDRIADTGNSIYEQVEIINALQVLSYAGLNDDVTLKYPLLKKLEALNFSSEVKQLSQADQDILDMIALIFTQIGQDETLPCLVKQAILPMQMPMAAVALSQPEVLFEPESAIRQLLDKLLVAGSLLNEESVAGQAIIQKITEVVNHMTTDRGFEMDGWVSAEHGFSVYLNAQELGAQRCAVHNLHIINQQAEMSRTDNAEAVIIQLIADKLKGKMLPDTINDFLQNVWMDVLVAVYPYRNEQSQLWQKYLQAIDHLVVSVLPPLDEQAKQHILHLLPGLIKALRHGLKQIAYDKVKRARFFKELAVLHVLALDKKATSNNEVAINHSVDCRADADSENDLLNIIQLPEGSWLAFLSDSGKNWGRLAWKSQDLQRLLFVDKCGEKLLECSSTQLLAQLNTGQANLVVINQHSIIERILDNLTP